MTSKTPPTTAYARDYFFAVRAAERPRLAAARRSDVFDGVGDGTDAAPLPPWAWLIAAASLIALLSPTLGGRK